MDHFFDLKIFKHLLPLLSNNSRDCKKLKGEFYEEKFGGIEKTVLL